MLSHGAPSIQVLCCVLFGRICWSVAGGEMRRCRGACGGVGGWLGRVHGCWRTWMAGGERDATTDE